MYLNKAHDELLHQLNDKQLIQVQSRANEKHHQSKTAAVETANYDWLHFGNIQHKKKHSRKWVVNDEQPDKHRV